MKTYVTAYWVLALHVATHTAGHHEIHTHSVTANAHYWSVS